ncbi:MAG: phosphatidate cytidylyltransferase [Ruminococcaceae bacterium]|nr:phosphatidate cytidylyltransferase [Oscillospiraceae bacterium]
MQDFLAGTGYTILYYCILAAAALLARFLIRIPDEIFRKTLHGILLGSLLVYVFGFTVWYHAALSCLCFAAVVFPILFFFERFKSYSHMVTERRRGELKSSLLLVFSMFAAVISVCWGWLGDRLLVLASVYAWGIGDAAAALIGKRFGRHKIPGTKKSFEGSLSMFLSSFLAVFLILYIRGGISLGGMVITALATGAVSAAVEVYTPGGMDTVSCPLAAMTVLLPLSAVFGG